MSTFREKLQNSINEPSNIGKVVVISGMSGSGKNFVASILAKNNYAFIDKYVTRPFRPVEISDIKAGRNIGIRAVSGLYNDGEKTLQEQENANEQRKQAFLDLRLPLAYINYGNYYGFSIDQINNYIMNGRNVVIIVNDIGVIRDLKDIYGDNCLACYVHRSNPKNREIFMEIARQRGDTEESAERRYQKAIKDFDRYTNNISLYDYTILNTQTGTDVLSTMLQDLSSIEPKAVHREKNMKKQKARIYVFTGSPGSGKDDALETVRVQGILHSIIMPKHTTRLRKPDDGEELICSDDKKFNIGLCDLKYENYGSTYGIDTNELRERLEAGISSSLVVSNRSALEALKEKFPEELVTIYIQGVSKEEYIIQQKEHLDEEYVKRRIQEYEKADELYYNRWLDFNHIIINNGDLGDMRLQIDSIMRYYEGDRELSVSNCLAYTQKANQYIARFARKNMEPKDKE